MNLLLQSISRLSLKSNSKAAILYSSRILAFMFAFCIFGLSNFNQISAHNSSPNYDMCDDVTNGGTIFTDEVGCGNPYFDPSTILSTNPATGGSGALEYLWMSTTDDPNGTSSIWNIIPGSSGESFDPPLISQTTSYRRCARRAGCTLWITESNIVTVELDCNLPNIGNTVFNDLNMNGIQDAGEPGVAGVMVKLLDAGADGVFGTGDENIVATETTDSNGNYLFENVDPGTYIIEFMSNSIPDGFVFTTQNAGGNDATDSDADANGQTDSFTVNFGDNNDLTFDAGIFMSCNLMIQAITGVNPMCNPGNTGIVALSVAGGTMPYTYAWSNEATTEDISNLPAGTYCVTVTDTNGCTVTDCATITAPAPITANGTLTAATCGQNIGNIDLSVNGGTGQYTYSWNNGATSQDLDNLVAGTYCVEITDANGCVINDCYVINNLGNISASISPSNNAICPGESITLSANSAGASSYSWTATGGTLGTSNGQSTSYTMMMPGTYTITVIVTSAQGCTASSSTDVVVYSGVTISGSTTDAFCGINNGSVSTSINSGTAPFSYLWSTGDTSPGLTNIASGNYCVTVTDANNCAQSECFTVNTGNVAGPLSISSPGFLCPGETINLNATSFDAVSYAWTATGGNLLTPNAQSTGYQMMMPGTYTITLITTNAQGCTNTTSTDVVVYESIILGIETITDANCGISDGAINISTTSGIAPFSYSWSTGATTQNISGLAAGTYCVTINDAVGCHSITECYNVNGSNANPVTISGPGFLCPGETINFAASSAGAVSYAWTATGGNLMTPNAQNTDYLMMMPGTYTITVVAINAQGCSATSSTDVVVYPAVTVGGTVTDASCNVNDGSIIPTISSGAAPFTFAWSTGATTTDISNLAPGTYCITLTDSNGCTDSECFNVNSSNSTPVLISGLNAICPGETINLTANSTDPASYSWTATGGTLGSLNGQTTSYTNTIPGTYTISVEATFSPGCVTSNDFVVVVYPDIEILSTVTDANCGANDGAINTTISSGNTPFTYNWSTGATTSGISGLAAGNFCVTVTDANGCVESECFNVNSSNANPVTISGPGFLCPGETINFAASSAGAVNYAWTATGGNLLTPNAQNTDYQMMMPGTYTITVVATNTQGCASSSSTDVVVYEPILLGNETITDANCGLSDGAINITTTSGIAPFSYSWSTGATTQNISGLAAGTYCVTINDAVGCHSITECYIVNGSNANPVTISGPGFLCPGETINFAASSAGAVSYAWTATGGNLLTPNAQNTDYQMMMPGTYTITVVATNAQGCQSMTSTDVVVYESAIVQFTATVTTCGEDNGIIFAQPMGGTAPYTYIWNTGDTTSDLMDIPAGNYCVTVTDNNGCISSGCVDIPGSTPLEVSISAEEITCTTLGSLNASATGGVAPYDYTWNTSQSTASISNLIAGEYCVTVTDESGCIDIQCFILDPVFTVTVQETISQPTCDSDNGSISLSVTPNVAVTYDWSTGANTSSIQNIGAGDYSVTVTTVAGGCSAVESYTLISEGDLTLSLTPTNPLCVGANNGSVTSMVTFSGSGSLTYSWNTGATTPNINNLPSGEYCVTVTSTDGCIAQSCVTLTAPNAINANGIVGSAGCEMENGNIKLNVMGGTAPFTYKWDNGETTKDIENLAPGEYCIVICDANGCTFQGCFTVDGGANFTTNIQTTPVSCHNDVDGSASATNVGGTTPFTYIWNTGATTPSISNLNAGTYCVTVTDIFGCSTQECATIDNPAPVVINASATDTTCDEDNGSATVSFNFSAQSVVWNGPGVNATTNTINNLAPGNYTVVVTDQNGCTATATVTVNPSIDLEISISPLNTTICPGELVAFTGTSNTTGTAYTWSATGGAFSTNTGANTNYMMMMPGTYTITLNAVNTAGCMDSATATVTVLDGNNPTCNPNIDLVNIGDFVFSDLNNNGIQDPMELGIGGIEVKLMTAGPDGMFYTSDDVTVATEVTDANGFYLFENVPAGDYIIMFCNTLPGTEYTSQNTGGNDELDSDANPSNGKTDPFTVVLGQMDDLSFDAGIILTPSGCDNVTNAGEICCDQMVCGAGSIPDLITSTTLPSGGSGAIEYIWMYNNIPGPFNMSTWMEIPGATGASYQPGPLFETIFVARCARRAGCDTYFETDIITLELLPAPIVTIQSLPAFICVNETDKFNSTNAGIGATYTWDLGAGASPATATGQFLTGVSWTTTGDKTITLTTALPNGCTFELTRTVHVGSCLNQSSSDRFIQFTATPVEESIEVDLKWTTNEDMNDFNFIVEHSDEGENFDIIYTMDGKDAFENKEYTFLDDEYARPGRNYYRIKHINNNGLTERSEMIMVTLSNNPTEKFILFPNPTVDYVIFESLKMIDEEGLIMISDMKGTILDQIVIPANTERMRVDVSNFSPGMYTFYTRYDNVRSIPQIIFKSEK